MKEANHTNADAPVEETLHDAQTDTTSASTPGVEPHASDTNGDGNLSILKALKGLSKEFEKEFEIDGTWLRRQLGVLAILLSGVIVYITNGYQAQQELFEGINLKKTLLDEKYKCLTRKSELTQKSRQSQIEKRLRALGDSTLCPSKEPLFKITKDNN